MSWERQPPPIFEGEDELQLKLQYARLCAENPRGRLTAGYTIFPGADNYGRALQCQAWFYDPFVQDEIQRLQTDDAGELLPTDDELEADLIRTVEGTHDPKDKIAGFRLLFERRGMVSKGGVNVKIDNSDRRVVNVLRVPSRIRTDEEREDFNRRFKDNQTKLIADARSNRPIAA
jgi:hypothetical protein